MLAESDPLRKKARLIATARFEGNVESLQLELADKIRDVLQGHGIPPPGPHSGPTVCGDGASRPAHAATRTGPCLAFDHFGQGDVAPQNLAEIMGVAHHRRAAVAHHIDGRMLVGRRHFMGLHIQAAAGGAGDERSWQRRRSPARDQPAATIRDRERSESSLDGLAGLLEAALQDGAQQGVAGTRIGCQPGDRRMRHNRHQIQSLDTCAQKLKGFAAAALAAISPKCRKPRRNRLRSRQGARS